jgi:hypothetical protein
MNTVHGPHPNNVDEWQSKIFGNNTTRAKLHARISKSRLDSGSASVQSPLSSRLMSRNANVHRQT